MAPTGSARDRLPVRPHGALGGAHANASHAGVPPHPIHHPSSVDLPEIAFLCNSRSCGRCTHSLFSLLPTPDAKATCAAPTPIQPPLDSPEIAFLCDLTELWTVRTLSVCRVLSISRDDYRSVARTHPADDRHVIANLLNRWGAQQGGGDGPVLPRQQHHDGAVSAAQERGRGEVVGGKRHSSMAAWQGGYKGV
ncbi:unnamed protein product [Closterium sp. Naga37s-1]|nr:unnamed protein product [Closterium sp. Naga37s-1]